MATPVELSRHFDRELNNLKQDLLRMAALAETAVGKSLVSVTNRDSDRAREVIIDDITLNRMELAIEEQALKLLALRQPVATDLRLTVAAARIATELERIGDQAVNIAERALELNSRPPLELPIDIKIMADLALGMVRTSIDAFVNQDPKLAIQVCQRDVEVDILDDEYIQKLLDSMIKESRWVTRLHHFIIIVRNLERIADLATNIAEDIVFIVEGRVIKHRCEDWMMA
ncbi:MAG: phosphate transport system regulatory protein PhoU [Deltaproteobacteria bacterium CG07_land_8_20_14_0_80_60_11]|nr:MAG: phosphate transport system regulatory protein PhoU [Deltaproteobacteria bacterium CG07_land_8_20_14_0_80_60_11]